MGYFVLLTWASLIITKCSICVRSCTITSSVRWCWICTCSTSQFCTIPTCYCTCAVLSPCRPRSIDFVKLYWYTFLSSYITINHSNLKNGKLLIWNEIIKPWATFAFYDDFVIFKIHINYWFIVVKAKPFFFV